MNRNPHTTPRLQNGLTVVGGAMLWALWLAVAGPALRPALLLLSPFVLVPLGLAVTARPENGPTSELLTRAARLAPVPAIPAAVSFMLEPGAAAAALTGPWLLFTLLVAGLGFGRLLSRPYRLDPTAATDAGAMFLLVGGCWLTITRAGLRPLGFDPAIVELTAVHFHYAGFALPIVVGAVAGRLGRSVAVPAAVVIGVPLTAIGITVGGSVEWVAATVMAIAGLATAILMLELALRAPAAVGTPARALLVLAGASLAAGMALALGWAWSIRFGWSYLGLDGMAASHGALNAIGFGLAGLLALAAFPEREDEVDADPDRAARPHRRVNLHLGRPSEAYLDALVRQARLLAPTSPAGLLHRPTPAGYRRQTWQRQADAGDFETTVDAMRNWQGHAGAGLAVRPPNPPIRLGQSLAVVIPVGPISVSATARVVEVIDEPDRFGFVYSTLPHHTEDGEELFLIERLDEGVRVTVTAVWRGARIANDVFPPLTRFLQNRAIERYLDGLTDPEADPDPNPAPNPELRKDSRADCATMTA